MRLRLILGFICCLAMTVPARVARAAANAEWPIYGGDYANTHYSSLKQINRDNVAHLRPAYMFQLGALASNESTPIVVGDTLYVSTSLGPRYVFALNAATGVMKWQYRSGVPESARQYGCCGPNNRGVAYSNGKIFFGQLDAKLVALDAKTGKVLWKRQVVDEKVGADITSPPLIIKNEVITGFAGGEYGVRGYLAAYDVNTGKLRWRTYSVPGPGEPGNDTWKGDSWKRGGAEMWLVGSYDPKLNILYWGTGNASPWNASYRGPDSSNYGKYTNLYTASVLAIDPDNGKILWHIQTTPYDAWDYDAVSEAVLANLRIGERTVPALMQANKNGFFYVANRKTGKLISAEPFVYVNWAKKIDLETGRPVENPDKRPTQEHAPKHVCPNVLGGKNWQPMSYSQQTGLVYIDANNLCMDTSVSPVRYHAGLFYMGMTATTYAGPGGFMGELLAWNPITQKAAWSDKEKFGYNGGVLSTAGGLVFYGNYEGWFKAVDARTGKLLWKFNVGTGVGAAPMTYEIGGRQYVALVVGRNTTIPVFMGAVGEKMTSYGADGGALVVFALDRNTKPGLREAEADKAEISKTAVAKAGNNLSPASADEASAGRSLFNQNCAHCHGPDAVSADSSTDLPLLLGKHGANMKAFYFQTMAKGIVSKGMPPWTGVLSKKQMTEIYAFLVHVQKERKH